jgi:hypothetical protein
MHSAGRYAKALRFSDLSPPRQELLRLCQSTNFGSIRGLEIKEGQPVFEPPPVLLIDLKLDSGDPPRPEANLTDFDLSEEVVRLMQRLDELTTTTIDSLEVRAGIPRRVIFRAALKGVSVEPPSRPVSGPPEPELREYPPRR